MKTGNAKQQAAYHAIHELHILEDLKGYEPTVCGTIPLGIDTYKSDIDIIANVQDLHFFEQKIHHLYEDKRDFRPKRKENIVKGNFIFHGFAFEIYGQPQPTLEQNAYLHMIIEYRLLQRKPEWKAEVITLKEQGWSTEAAFCKLLRIDGDPYQQLIDYGRQAGLLF
ncbi:DUF4269 domain-containing protein [Halobacillus locisalis]|uniref:DUF4269 domain-containing protein n=2 Tax=Halobacillus locisalis TaxID=220753 RepID=A0A838CQ30_9BACI|nr:DUF4269 domain-containing protein [Halobacillus locisalis]